MENYDFEVLHRPGKNQGHVDALSRLPMDMVHFLGKEKTVLTSTEDTVQVLEWIHKDGHLGVKKTLKLFRQRFEGIREKTLCQAMVSSCEGCQLGSDYKPRALPQLKIESTSPWDVISTDIMRPFISGRKGERYIQSMIDCFSRNLILIPIKDHNPTTVSQALFERVIRYFGCPRKILSDRGTEFTGRVWSEMMEWMGIKQLLTSPYYPQGNGIMERSHRTVGNMVRAQLANRDGIDWVDALPGVMLLLNEMEQDNHGYSASQIMWGQGMNLPADLIYTAENSGKGDRSKYVKDLEKELREARKRVAPFSQAASRPLAKSFREGDLILIYQQQMEKTHKLSPRWRGPLKMIKSPNSFQVIYNDQGREKITHMSNCKKFQERLVGMRTQAPPPGDAIPKQKNEGLSERAQKPMQDDPVPL